MCPCRSCKTNENNKVWGLWATKPGVIEEIALKDGALEHLETKKRQIQEAIDRLTRFEYERIWRSWVDEVQDLDPGSVQNTWKRWSEVKNDRIWRLWVTKKA
jgi:predicted nuclease with TOPRIM domain